MTTQFQIWKNNNNPIARFKVIAILKSHIGGHIEFFGHFLFTKTALILVLWFRLIKTKRFWICHTHLVNLKLENFKNVLAILKIYPSFNTKNAHFPDFESRYDNQNISKYKQPIYHWKALIILFLDI